MWLVYLVADKMDRCCPGITQQAIAKRMKGYITHNPDARLIGVWPISTNNVADARLLERYIQFLLGEENWISGEWFKIPVEKAYNLIDEVVKMDIVPKTDWNCAIAIGRAALAKLSIEDRKLHFSKIHKAYSSERRSINTKRYMETLTPEQRSERSRLARAGIPIERRLEINAKISAKMKVRQQSLTPEQRSAIAMKRYK